MTRLSLIRCGVVLSLVMSLIGLASAETAQDRLNREREAARVQRQFEELAKKLPKVDPEPGRDKAVVRAPPWCDLVKDVGEPSPSSLLRTITAPGGLRDKLLSAAPLTCRWPNEPSVQQAVAVIEQSWINMTGLSAAQALETLKARMQVDRFKADGAKLCDALKISPEILGEEKAFMAARRSLFGCSVGPLPNDLLGFLDASVNEPDELVRLELVADHSQFAFGNNRDSYFDKQLVSYAVDQIDYQALSTPKIMKILDTAPYAGNSFARTLALEALGRARMAIAIIDAEVKKKSADADWKELLVTAPQRGVAEWTKKAAQHKDALARSNEFENKFWGPSRKALAGCWDTLRPDFAALIKTLPHGSANELTNSLSDPITSLLFERLVACSAARGDTHAFKLVPIVQKLRYARGPRLAAYYATIDAFSTILADRTKFPVSSRDLFIKTGRGLLSEASSLAMKNLGANPFVGGEPGKGTVKAVKKVAGGVQVTFVTEKHQEMDSECSDTNRIHSFHDNGNPVYYQNCRFTKMITVDTTAGAITVPTEMADGIGAGAVVEFEATLGESPKRIGLPTAVYKDKSKKQLVNFYGFGL